MDSNAMDDEKVQSTRDRILLEAAILFAHRGYAAVSIRDIANKVNIKAASIYNHFYGKEDLFNVIVDNIRDVYMSFFARLEGSMGEATNFEEMLDSLFAELVEVYHIFIYYGISLIATEQFRDDKARDVFINVLIRDSIAHTKMKFDASVENKWVKPFDTQTVSTFFNHSVMIGTLMRTHEDMQHETPYNVSEMFTALRHYIYNSLEVIKEGNENS